MNIYRGRTIKDFAFASTLYDAIEDNDVRGVSCLLKEKGADPNIVLPATGISPFHLAIGNNLEEFAYDTTKLILQHGGNPNIQSEEGLTPLHIAAAWGRTGIAKLLICCGADPEIRDDNCRIPLHYAVDHKELDTVQFLHDVMYGVTILNLQEKEGYLLSLEKLIINNGAAEAEYEVDTDNEYSLEIVNSISNLQNLPQTTPNEYVRNWCQTHALATQIPDIKQSEPEVKKKDSSFNTFICSSDSSRMSPKNVAFVNCNRRIPNNNVIENISLQYECSKKYKLRKSLAEKRGVDIPNNNQRSFGLHMEVSRESGIVTLPESGIVTLPDTTQDISKMLSNVSSNLSNLLNVDSRTETSPIIKRSQNQMRDASSDYFTCNEISGSTNILEQNIFEISSLSVDKSNSPITNCNSYRTEINNEVTNLNGVTDVPYNISDKSLSREEDLNSKDSSFVSIVEVYKYTDKEEGIVLFEKRLLVNQKSNANDSSTSPVQSQSSKLSSLPASFDYDTDTLRQELSQRGFDPGPITRTTKRVYLRKLHHLKKRQSFHYMEPINETNKVFSMELEKTFKNPDWVNNLSAYKELEDTIFKDFSNPDPSRKWREGINKSSFTYLLLDPRVTNNLPGRTEQLPTAETWKTFVSSIFYVGKGKRSRPYSHLYEAITHWNNNNFSSTNNKLQCILNIWKDNRGVVCLHVFQNVIPVEAYTREAAMINALKLDNIGNKKSGDFYGTASTWSSHQQRMLGVLLLYKAMLIFLNEGERQLRPVDIN